MSFFLPASGHMFPVRVSARCGNCARSAVIMLPLLLRHLSAGGLHVMETMSERVRRVRTRPQEPTQRNACWRATSACLPLACTGCKQSGLRRVRKNQRDPFRQTALPTVPAMSLDRLALHSTAAATPQRRSRLTSQPHRCRLPSLCSEGCRATQLAWRLCWRAHRAMWRTDARLCCWVRSQQPRCKLVCGWLCSYAPSLNSAQAPTRLRALSLTPASRHRRSQALKLGSTSARAPRQVVIVRIGGLSHAPHARSLHRRGIPGSPQVRSQVRVTRG